MRTELESFRAGPDSELTQMIDAEPITAERAGPSGKWCQIDIQAFWDDRPDGNIRVLDGVSGKDDGKMKGKDDGKMKGIRQFRSGRVSAFTLIELLIVVAIIAILAAIAVPNFLEAQTRAKISRTKSDMRSLATALESYFSDYNEFPETQPINNYSHVFVQYLSPLTTPVAYITSVDLVDPFTPAPDPTIGWTLAPDWKGTYQYIHYGGFWGVACHPDFVLRAFIIHTYGPSRAEPHMSHYPYTKLVNPNYVPGGHYMWPPAPEDCLYDPSNGTRSRGGIGRCSGFPGLPQALGG